MTETMRDLLARGAELVERPALDVADLVAQAERRLVRRRVAAVVASAAAVAVVVAGGIALRPDDQKPSPAPPAPSPTETHDSKPAPPPAPAIYFDALAVDGDTLTDKALGISGPKDIYLTREGGATRQLIATAAHEHCPRVSPDGSMLAYLEGGTTVVVRRLDATGVPGATAARVRYSTDPDGLSCPQWSPDGRRLAVAVTGFDEEAYEQNFAVRVIGVDGTDRLVALPQAQWMPSGEFAWSPDGDAIAYTTPDSVWIAPLDGGEPQRLWQGREPGVPGSFPPYPGLPTQLSFLATGELAVSTQTEVDGVEALRIIDPGTGRDRVLGNFPVSYPTTWAWSPDGSRLVFADTDGSVRLFDRASGTTVPVRPRLHRHVLPIWKVVWSADGRRLVGTAADDDPSTTTFAMVSIDPDGSSLEVLTPWTLALYSEADASWSPR